VNHPQTLERRYLGIIGGALLDLLKVCSSRLLHTTTSISAFGVLLLLLLLLHRDCSLQTGALSRGCGRGLCTSR